MRGSIDDYEPDDYGPEEWEELLFPDVDERIEEEERFEEEEGLRFWKEQHTRETELEAEWQRNKSDTWETQRTRFFDALGITGTVPAYLVSVEFASHNQHDYGPFFRKLAAFQAKRLHQFLWLITDQHRTDMSIYRQLAEYLGTTDHLCVVGLTSLPWLSDAPPPPLFF